MTPRAAGRAPCPACGETTPTNHQPGRAYPLAITRPGRRHRLSAELDHE